MKSLEKWKYFEKGRCTLTGNSCHSDSYGYNCACCNVPIVEILKALIK